MEEGKKAPGRKRKASGNNAVIKSKRWTPLKKLAVLAPVIAVVGGFVTIPHNILTDVLACRGAGKKAAEEEHASCESAELILKTASLEISPLFPDVICRDPGAGRDVPGADAIENKLNGVRELVESCRAASPERAAVLDWKLLLIPAQAERYALKKKSNARYRKIRTEATQTSDGADHPLLALRDLEIAVDELGALSSDLENEQDPCKTVNGWRWRATLAAADEAFFRVAAWVRKDPKAIDLKGCAWTLRSEQALLQAGACGNSRSSRFAQALIAARRASELTNHPDLLTPLFNSVFHSTKPEDSGPALRHDRPLQGKRAISALQADAEAMHDDEFATGPSEMDRALSVLGDQAQVYEWLRGVYVDLLKKWKGGDPTELIYLQADTVLYQNRPEGALRLLHSKTFESGTLDYQHAVLEGRAFCFLGRFEESLESFHLAYPLWDASLGRRWGFSTILESLCMAGSGKLKGEELDAELEERIAEVEEKNVSREDAIQDICDLSFQAPRLLADLRRQGALAKFVGECGWVPAGTSPTSSNPG